MTGPDTPNPQWTVDDDLLRDAAKWIRSYHGNYRDGEPTNYATMLTARGVIGSFVTEYTALAAQNRALWDFVRAYDGCGDPTRLNWTGTRERLRAARAALDATDRLPEVEAERDALRAVEEAVRAWGEHTPRRVSRALAALDAARAALGETS